MTCQVRFLKEFIFFAPFYSCCYLFGFLSNIYSSFCMKEFELLLLEKQTLVKVDVI